MHPDVLDLFLPTSTVNYLAELRQETLPPAFDSDASYISATEQLLCVDALIESTKKGFQHTYFQNGKSFLQFCLFL
jgi:hypothetical protein